MSIEISSYLYIMISDLKKLDTNKNFFLKTNQSHSVIFKKIMHSLSDDLLLFGSDRLIHVELFIDPMYFNVDISEGFPFMSGSSLTFSFFDFEDDDSLSGMIDNAIIKTLKDTTHHLECQIDDYKTLFENIHYVDELLRLNNSLFNHLIKANYSLETHGERDDFEYFRIEKHCLGTPSVNIQTPMFAFFIEPDYIMLRFKDNEMKMNIRKDSNKNYLQTLEQIFLVLFNNEDVDDKLLHNINNMNDLSAILPMIFT